MLTIKSNESNPLRITLQEEIRQFEEIVVVGDAITYKNGSILVNVSQFPGVDNLQAINLMERLPGVMKTSQEGYTMNGLKATIYINGIKQQISEKSLTSYLEALPANALSQVELVLNASGQYGADTGAVIHIQTKKNMPEGSSFQIGTYASVFDSDLNDTGMDLFYMLKKGNVLFNSLMTYSNDNDFRRSSDSTVFPKVDRVLVNEGHTKGRNNALTWQNNQTWALNKGHRLDFNSFIYYDIDRYNSYWESKKATQTEMTNESYYHKTRGNDDLWSGSVYYTSPQERDFKLKAYYNGLYGGIRTDNKHYQTVDSSEPHMSSDIEMVGHMHAWAADVETRISPSFPLSFGIKLDLNVINDHADYLGVSDDRYTSRSKFWGREILPAAYVMSRYNLSKSLGLMAVLRAENTNYTLDYKTEALVASNSYTALFPTLSLFMNTDAYNGTLGLYSGISRPNYAWLLPGKRYVNEYTYTQGNPDIDPMKYYMVVFNNTFFKFFQLNLRYEKLNNTSGAILMEDRDERIYQTYMNYADLNRYSVGITLPYRFLNGKIFGQFIGYMGWNEYKNFKNGFELPPGRTPRLFNGNVRFNVQYDITDRLNFNMIARLDPYRSTLQVDTETSFSADLGVYYSLLQKKNLIVGFNVENLFNSSNVQQAVHFSDYHRYMYRQTKGPIFNFSLKLRINRGQHVVDEYKDRTPSMERMSK